MNYADRLLMAIKEKQTPCVVGLDPRLENIPQSFRAPDVRDTIRNVNAAVIEAAQSLVPAVKLQVAFYEQYGTAGIAAFVDTIGCAKDHGLLVIVDAKRGDIASTAAAYARAYLWSSLSGGAFDVDAITVNPFLGRDTIEPFIEACTRFDKGIFVLVKTSNPGSSDVQDAVLDNTGERLYERLAQLVDTMGGGLVGQSGFSAIGAVVGATFPDEAVLLRRMMPRAIFLVPGYGAQGGTARDVIPCFDGRGRGAIVNASRAITAGHSDSSTKHEFMAAIRARVEHMIGDVADALGQSR
jgi:orotidine-5'-phosphate decarboxylase